LAQITRSLFLGIAAAFIGAFLCSFFSLSGLAAIFAAAGLVFTIWVAILQERARKEFFAQLQECEADAEESICAAEAEKTEAHEECQNQIKQFHSKISHGFRMPMSVIQGYADLLKGNLVTDEEARQEYLLKICDKITYMNELFGQLLLEDRIRADFPSVILEPLEISALVQKIADDISIAAQKLDIEIRTVFSDNSIMVRANANLLIKVFYNILENSLKYMGGAGRISITVSRLNDEVLLVFKDDGMGLDPKETEHIFEMDYQGSNKLPGNGFGLYFAKTGVEAHGGTIFAKSDYGNGMCIFIRLPLCSNEDNAG